MYLGNKMNLSFSKVDSALDVDFWTSSPHVVRIFRTKLKLGERHSTAWCADQSARCHVSLLHVIIDTKCLCC